MNVNSRLFCISTLTILAISCSDDDTITPNAAATNNTITDIDGNNYEIVEIGTQKWLNQNLKTTKLNDGVELILNEGDDDMGFLNYSWYENNEGFGDNLGAIYHQSVITTGKICPLGWRVPSDSDWFELETFLGITDPASTGFRGDSASYKLKESNSTFWDESNQYSTDQYGFRARGGGIRNNRLVNQISNYFDGIMEYTYYYTSTKGDSNSNGYWLRGLSDDQGGIFRTEPSWYFNPYGEMTISAYIRCVEDN